MFNLGFTPSSSFFPLFLASSIRPISWEDTCEHSQYLFFTSFHLQVRRVIEKKKKNYIERLIEDWMFPGARKRVVVFHHLRDQVKRWYFETREHSTRASLSTKSNHSRFGYISLWHRMLDSLREVPVEMNTLYTYIPIFTYPTFYLFLLYWKTANCLFYLFQPDV